MDVNEVYEMSLEKAYKLFLLEKENFEPENVDIKDVHKKVRYGINLHFDVYKYFNNDFITRKAKRELIRIGKYWYDEKGMFTEIENREILLKKILIDNLTDDKKFK